MNPRGRFAIVTIAIANVRRAPRHDAELSNQLLLGEAVRVESERDRGEWLRISGFEDGYAGWTRAWGLRRVTAAECRAWWSSSRAWFGAPLGELRREARGAAGIGPIFLGSRVRPAGTRAHGATVRLPDGTRARIVAVAPASAPRAGAAERLRRRLASLGGAPYLWGGRTIAGIDCSGLTQLAFAELGVRLARDAKDQFREVPRLASGETVRLGDLAFFGRRGEPVSHVGIMLDRCSFVHARGVVHTGSIDPDSSLYDNRLSRQLRGFGRPAGAAFAGPRRPSRLPKSP